ncbi:hypothetical protein A0U89_12180 [Kozakia baliensis]|uniref:Uncharacterized protein n=1 Tax=Kozakia baliensis TaxID=153496 RepID=A0A1D8UVW4_9PROT|nr:hypothetical protein A0U89_12180 [Kozakia baliensis]GEL65584.1 hypothetical protein KBA01_28700 [Kozakia baliensis]
MKLKRYAVCVDDLVADGDATFTIPVIEGHPVALVILQPDIVAVRTAAIELLLDIGFVRCALL